MKKVYLEYPYINSLNTKVIHKKIINGEYHFELEQTIFFPGMDKVKSDTGWINQNKILDIYEENNKVYHVLKENLGGTVQLDLDWDERIQRMQDHSCLFIIQYYLKEIFNLDIEDYRIDEQCFFKVQNKEGYLLENICNRLNTLLNDYILSSLPIKSYFEESIRKEHNKTYQIRKHFVKLINLSNYPCQDTLVHNTSEIRGFYIKKFNIKNDSMVFEFISGNRLFDQWSRVIKEFNKLSDTNKNLEKQCIDENTKLSKENLLLKTKLIDCLLGNNDNSCREVDLKDLSLTPEDFMMYKPKKPVFAYLKKEKQIHFYTNDPSHIPHRYPDKNMNIISHEYDHICGILKNK